MGRTLFKLTLGVLALPVMSVPAMAQGKGVNCMRGAYSAAQLEELGQLTPSSSAGETQLEQAVFDQIGAIAMTAIGSCAASRGWTDEQILHATLFEMGRLSEAAYRASGELSSQQLRQLDDALAIGNRDRLWSVIEAGVMGGMSGGEAPVSNGDAMLLGTFIIGAGLDVEDQDTVVAEKVGMLLGFMGLQRMGRREFVNLN
ncbi:hypothetical protein [Aurantiacibacter marinus]|uniref:Lipoprotein n=1 Tax=Aurantiacibacter marinus TaxID=874156 RepID=A0A0H0XMT8_9SPHN|nr:hypothetical protein [Aurantiacibacter marinus]KLI63679.1 hypothetical protein AAV99_08060 [Aurantiacibacter marinus]